MNIKTVAKMAVGIVGMGVAYVVSGKCGDYAKTAFDSRNDVDNGLKADEIIEENSEEISEDEIED